ncbi:MAG: CPBP family intramembrane metalloprotease [Gracilimonas sp.]|uniref:CPBP family intramembrane glutamic endopeptidase n=1 Tax=Gracilimonas sp. TaxID=1974203 RepID=UPI0019A20DAE|nr:CPBP family intramembrane glutamic endopeptidase [Gracilimonas sp.]MBD3617183.1 CPBP family intramembrane metalloprotease [Gracilimonas sp.]
MENETRPEQTNNELSGLTTGRLLIMSVVSANIYVFFSFLIIRYWHEGGLNEIFESTFLDWEQVGIGLAAGCGAAGLIFIVINLPPVSKVLSDFTIFEALSKANFSFFDNTQVSLFAGAGEELLFRGAIQPLLGNTLTSFIFIAIHGYFKFKSPGHILFGLMMFGLSFMLGFLFEYIGLISAMIAHSVYDLIMLQVIQRKEAISN